MSLDGSQTDGDTLPITFIVAAYLSNYKCPLIVFG
jgi:hypothetical protein